MQNYNYIKLQKIKRKRDLSVKLRKSKLSSIIKNDFYKYNKYKEKHSCSPDINCDKFKIMKKAKIELLKKLKKTIVKINIRNQVNKIEESLEYIKLKELGKGAFGECYLFESIENEEQCAVKIISKDKIDNIRNEITIQQDCDHPNIVKVKKYTEDNDKVYLLLELCQNNTLQHLLEKRKYLTEVETQYYIFQLIQGLKYLHNRKIIHRDLKPSNLFLDEKLNLKIGDFGLVVKLDDEKIKRNDYRGTPGFMAPEILNKENEYSFEVDIWSLGIIMYDLLTGQLPFKIKTVKNGYETGQKTNNDFSLNFPQEPQISEVAKDLIKQILDINPKKRPGLNQILYHDFFHIGTIPKVLNISTLSTAPTIEEIRKYMPNADENGRVNKEVVNKCLSNIIPNNYTDIKYEDIDKFVDDNNINIKDKGIDYWLTVFHESHYGFYYYEFNNKLKGIIFKKNYRNTNNKDLHLILNEMTDEIYEINNESEKISKYKVDKCPESLELYLRDFVKYSKKRQESINNDNNKSEENYQESSIIESQSFSDYSETCVNNSEEGENEKKNIIHIKSFNKQNKATFFELSNDVKQVNFKDGVKIIFSEEKGFALYIDKEKKKQILSLVNILKNENKKFHKRMKYIKNNNIKELNNKLNKRKSDLNNM